MNYTTKNDQTVIDQRNILPDSLSQTNQNPLVQPNISPINQISNMYSPIKKTYSENEHKVLPKLTPQSPYIQKVFIYLCS